MLKKKNVDLHSSERWIVSQANFYKIQIEKCVLLYGEAKKFNSNLD